MHGRVLTVANMKGGVGKTSLVLALSQLFAAGGPGARPLRVLVIDLDAQANASFWLCGDIALADLIERGKTIDAFFEDAIVGGASLNLEDYALDLAWEGAGAGGPWIIPSSPGLRKAERVLIRHVSRTHRNLLQVERVIAAKFAEQIDRLKPAFDLILIDSGPSITAFSQAALAVGDLIIAPTVPVFVASLGLESFCRTVLHASADDDAERHVPWVLANRVTHTGQQQQIMAELRAEAAAEDRGFAMFSTEIPELGEAGESGIPGAVAGLIPEVYALLAREILEVINDRAA
jgi:cellulose biosynthesis protein BcsQ